MTYVSPHLNPVTLLRYMPWGVSVHERLKLFRGIVDEERVHIQGAAYEVISLLTLTQPEQHRSKGTHIKVILHDCMTVYRCKFISLFLTSHTYYHYSQKHTYTTYRCVALV